MAQNEIVGAKVSKLEVIERQIEVLKEIDARYFSRTFGNARSNKVQKVNTSSSGNLPDQELGFLGERHVYEREIAHAKRIGASPSDVEWISQSVPQSPFDIKSVRKTNGKLIDHYIEVKSSRAEDDSNIYVSYRQIEFFKKKEDCSSFAFVSFDKSGSIKSIREISLSTLLEEFELSPIKFKLKKK